MDVRVLKIQDDASVWISVSSIDKLHQLEVTAAEIGRAQSHTQPTTPSLYKGHLCVVRWNDKWCRGQIKGIYTSSLWNKLAEILLCDYGDCITVPLNSVLSVESSYLAHEPPLAKSYFLSPLFATPTVLDGSRVWSEVVMEIIREKGGVCDEWGVMLKGCIGSDNSLQLFTENEANINQLLIRKGLLIITEESMLLNKSLSQERDLLIQSTPLPSPPPPPLLSSPCHSSQSLSSLSNFSSPARSMTSVKDKPLTVPVPQIISPSLPAPFNYVSPLLGEHSKYLESLKQYFPPKPKTNIGVYIEGISLSDHTAWPTLEDTPFSSAVRKSLKERGFQFPTSIQCNGWNYLWNGHDTLLCSPHRSGKTLTYLLPLLCLTKEKEEKTIGNDYQPKIIVLVSDSFTAWNISEQAKTIMSWLDAAKRFRSCPVYATVENEAHIHILNGVDIITATPPGLVRLIKKGILTFTTTAHLVFDDSTSLLDTFSSELHDIISLIKQCNHLCQLVACTSVYNPQHWSILGQYMNERRVSVCTDMIEICVMKKQPLKVLYSAVEQLESQILSLVKKLSSTGSSEGYTVVCVRNEEEGIQLLKLFSLHCLNVTLLNKRDNNYTFANITIMTDKTLVAFLQSTSLPIIKSLIHYTLPNSKDLFMKRTSLLLSSLYDGNTIPLHVVLLTPSCHSQSRLLLTLMERLGDIPPHELVSMATERLSEKKRRDPLWDICLQMKCYGMCRIKECNKIHSKDELSLIPHAKLPLPTVPKDGIVKVIVESVSSPCHLWVRILDHAPLHRGDMPIQLNSAHLSHLSMDLALYYSDHTHRILHTTPCIGDYCGLQCDNGSYYRVKITEFSHPLGLFFHHKEQAKVHLIDTGEHVIVDVNQLYSLPPTFLTTPPLVIETFLCGLVPPDSDTAWPTLSTCQASKTLSGHTLTGSVALSLRGTIWLDPVEERLILSSVGVISAIERPQKQFLSNGIALENKEHLNLLKNAFTFTETNTTPLYDDYTTVTPPSGCGFLVALTAVEEPDHFYVQMNMHKNELNSIVERLNDRPKATSNSFNKNDSIIIGGVYAALFPFDNKWYRACVMERRENENEEKESLCFFADYGDLEWVNERNIEYICEELLQLPFQAICCQLYDLPSQDLPDDITERLWDITRNRLLTIELINSDPEFCSAPFPPTTRHCVNLRTEDKVSLVDILLTSSSQETCDDESLPAVQMESPLNDLHNYSTEFTLILNLLLSEESDVISSEFIPFILSRHGHININDSHCTQLSEYFTDNYNISSDIIKGLLLIVTINTNSSYVMTTHGGFCQSLLIVLKTSTSTDVQKSTLQLIYALLLLTNELSLNYADLLTTVYNLVITEREGCGGCSRLLNICYDTLAYLIITVKISQLQLICSLFNGPINDDIVILVCSLLNSEHGYKLLSSNLSSLLKEWHQFTKHLETLLLALLVSSLRFTHLPNTSIRQLSSSPLCCSLSPFEILLYEIFCASIDNTILDNSNNTETKYIIDTTSLKSKETSHIDESTIEFNPVTTNGLADTNTTDIITEIEPHFRNVLVTIEESTSSLTYTTTNDLPITTTCTNTTCLEGLSQVVSIDSDDKENKRDFSIVNNDGSHFIEKDSGFSSSSCKGSHKQCNKKIVENSNKTHNCIPSVLWSQSHDQIILNIPLRGCIDYGITLNDASLHMWCTDDNKKYSFSLELFGDTERHVPRKNGSGIIIKLFKATRAYWPRLTSSKNRPSFVGIDHDRWRDSSDEEDGEKQKRFIEGKFSLSEQRKILSHFSSSEGGEGEESREEEEDDDDEGSQEEEDNFENELLDFLPN